VLDDIILGSKDLELILKIEDNKEIRKEYENIKAYINTQKLDERKFYRNFFNVCIN